MFRLKGRAPSEKRVRAAFDELRDLVRERCLALGGVPVPDDLGGTGVHSVSIVVPTALGPLWVWGPHCSEFLSVFARFQDPARGAGAFGANPHSGKWNTHGGTIREGAKPRAVFDQWARELDVLKGGTREEIDAAIETERERVRRVRAWHEQEKHEEKGA